MAWTKTKPLATQTHSDIKAGTRDAPDPHGPPAGQQCANCKFYNLYGQKRCFRYPPVIATNMFPNIVTVFPTVTQQDWCGEWQTNAAA